MLTAKEIDDMSDASLVNYIQGKLPLNMARKVFTNARITIGNKECNSKIRYSSIQMRRDELKACIAIVNAINGVLR